MSYEVYVHLGEAEKHFEALNKEFEAIHDQEFMCYCNIDFFTGKGEWQKCEHGLEIMTRDERLLMYLGSRIVDMPSGRVMGRVERPPTDRDIEAFITAPCHWDYDHMVQTEKDIQQAAGNLDLQVKTQLSY